MIIKRAGRPNIKRGALRNAKNPHRVRRLNIDPPKASNIVGISERQKNPNTLTVERDSSRQVSM